MKKFVILGAVLLAGLLLAACSTATPTPVLQEVPVTVEVPVEVTRMVEVTVEPAVQAPYEESWAASPHADASAEAFRHWDTENPAEVPASCAQCHSTPGYLDYLGADGSPAGTVENNVPVGTVVSCDACHNPTTQNLTSVSFPSGATITGLGDEARCMVCHQGRASVVQVDEAIQAAGLTDEDTSSPDLGFTNIHYFAAAVSRYGTQVKGGYEYAGKTYDVLFEHVNGVQSCTDCHDSHSLEVKVDTCAACHSASTTEELKNIRMASSMVDYDGDGDLEEGIYYEIEGLQAKLYEAIQAYARDVAGSPIGYNAHAYPYFFVDPNGDGTLAEDEAVYENKYASWTARLAKAAYNYQMSLKDPGAFAHGGKYIIELLYDSIEDLNTQLATPIDMTGMHRVDAGHFAGSEEAFRHWDEEGEVPGSCAKCHSAEGLPVFLANATNVAAEPSNGLLCESCHDDLTTYSRYAVNEVKFPSGAMVSFGEGADANLCINCHQGRESTTSVNNAIKGANVGDDNVSEKLRFRNVHYFAAGATLFGDVAKGAYQYDGQTYLGQFTHGDLGPTDCVSCHNSHGLEVQAEDCTSCHKSVETDADLANIRGPNVPDYDGDGDTEEGIAGEITTMQAALYAALQAYAVDTAGLGILYDSHAYPYFFGDLNGNGALDADEANGGNAFAAWTPRLLRAAYNYQYSQKDPGAYAHNGKYVVQVLYDSLKDIGADVSGMTRP